MPTSTPLAPGKISPRRPVPAGIARPEYVDRPAPAPFRGTEVKDEETIERMRHAGRIAAQALQLCGQMVRPGVMTDEIDRAGHEFLLDHGAYPSTLGYRGFPKSLCTSVNEVICHGIPDARALRDGDIVNLDVTVYREGVHGDTNATFFVGSVDPESQRLVRVTRECLSLAIDQVRPGAPINALGRAIQDHAEAAGLGVVRAFVGHGIGETFHTDLAIPHYHDPRATRQLEAGMVFTIEPMITVGDWRHRLWDDDWTAVTSDLKRTAQFEHTIVVTDDGADLLTLRSDGLWSGDGGQPGDPLST